MSVQHFSASWVIEARWIVYASGIQAIIWFRLVSPAQCQANIWTNDGLLSTGPLETNFIEISIKEQEFPIKKMHLKIVCAKRGHIVLASKWW